jgi:two-component system chemotaxis response regulator CheB
MVRRAVVRILTSEAAFEIVGEAKDPYEAKDLIIHHDPDVITLDIEMPSMDGMQFLKLIMELRPRPVIIVSTLTHAGSNKSVEALMNRAFDVVGKPLNATDLNRMGPELISR